MCDNLSFGLNRRIRKNLQHALPDRERNHHEGNCMKTILAVLILGLASLPAWAVDVTVSDVWVRTTVPGQKVSGAFMRIVASEDARLVSASSAVVPRVEIHEMKMDGDVMRMREVETIDLPKGRTVLLQPGGYHLMLMNLAKPIAAGDRVPLSLVIESGGTRQTVEVEAEARVPGAGMRRH
jgi:copper(I)-binding protein